MDYGAELNDFDVGKSLSRAMWKGWALKIKIFLGPEWQRVPFGPKKLRFSGGSSKK